LKKNFFIAGQELAAFEIWLQTYLLKECC